MKLYTRILVLLALVVSSLCLPNSAQAQQTQATLTGTVTDPSGADISGAKVVITNTDTNISRSVDSDGEGRYLVTNLNPGKYTVTAEAAGFSKKELTGIVLAVGQNASLNVELALGQVGEVVSVSAAAAVVDTESSSQGTVVDNQKVVGIPLNQRTFYGLAMLSPGASPSAQSSTLGFRGGFNVAGNNETANTFTVNGIDDNDQNVMAPSFRPSIEAIQEFKLLTGVYQAEYGRTSGGQVVVVTKTGSNAIHGDAFEFIRNSVADAKNAFTPADQNPQFRRNQYGGTIGGPIIKDKTFFFISYEAMRLSQQVVTTGTVPLTAWKSGDFSSLCGAAGGTFNSAGVCHKVDGQTDTIVGQLKTPTSTNNYLPYNQVPSALFSSFGRQIMSYYPAPDNAGSTTYTQSANRIENMDEGSVRVDHHLTDADSLLIQFNYFQDPTFEVSNSLCGSSQIPGFGCNTNQVSWLAGVNWTHIFNERWLNEFRFGYDRLAQPRVGEDVKNSVNIPGAFSDPSVPTSMNGGVPYTSVVGLSTLHPYTNLPQNRVDNHYNLVNNTTWTHGAHSVKFGVNLLQARYADLFVSYGTGAFTFNTSSAASVGPTTGNAVADLLTGYGYSSTRNPTAPNIQVIYSQYSGYLQDDWKVTPNLTLNIGMRYEYFSPTRDARNRLSNYIPANGTTPQYIAVAGAPGVGTYVYKGDFNNWAPRVGFAFKPFSNDRTVFHGGYGVFYNSPAIGNGANLSMGIQAPFRLPQTLYTTNSNPVQLDTTPFPTGGVTADGTAANPYTGVSLTAVDQHFNTMYIHEWAADVQQQLTSTTALTIAYLGSHGLGIPRSINLNQGNPSFNLTTGKMVSTRPITAETCVSYPSLICYSQFSNITNYKSAGQSNYNQFSAKLQKNYSNGFSAIVAYTWAKSFDNAPGYASGSANSSGTAQDSYNLNAERGLSDFDTRHRVVISPVYELPFGKNKPFLQNGWGAKIAGGWQLSGMGQIATGRPFTVSNASSNISLSFNNADRPNIVPGQDPNAGPKTRAEWFNTSAFQGTACNLDKNGNVVTSTSVPNCVVPGHFGTAGRNILNGPGFVNIDVAVQRIFQFTERYGLQFRGESFNVANKVNYNNPLGTGNGAFGAGSNYGKLTSAQDPRQMQVSVKFLF